MDVSDASKREPEAVSNFPFIVEDSFACGCCDEIHVATLGRVVAAATAALAPELKQRFFDEASIVR